jgi:hypothetical protein
MATVDIGKYVCNYLSTLGPTQEKIIENLGQIAFKSSTGEWYANPFILLELPFSNDELLREIRNKIKGDERFRGISVNHFVIDTEDRVEDILSFDLGTQQFEKEIKFDKSKFIYKNKLNKWLLGVPRKKRINLTSFTDEQLENFTRMKKREFINFINHIDDIV